MKYGERGASNMKTPPITCESDLQTYEMTPNESVHADFSQVRVDLCWSSVDTIISSIPYDTRIVFDTRYSILALQV